MADMNTDKAPKKSFWKGLKAEFRKIIWPNKDTVTKQTAVVLAVSLALGVLIGVLDMIFKFGISLII
ncbi:MAG: preprotein translocase subunit SecE [Lachnospiraceae bacterium]|nr:preprotein translocase subunit SecE [Lachnospiraceae bacterium]